MSAEPNDEQAARDARREQYRLESRARTRRTQAKFQIVLAVLWVGLAAVRWFDDNSATSSRWLFTGLAGCYVVVGVVLYWRELRRPPT